MPICQICFLTYSWESGVLGPLRERFREVRGVDYLTYAVYPTRGDLRNVDSESGTIQMRWDLPDDLPQVLGTRVFKPYVVAEERGNRRTAGAQIVCGIYGNALNPFSRIELKGDTPDWIHRFSAPSKLVVVIAQPATEEQQIVTQCWHCQATREGTSAFLTMRMVEPSTVQLQQAAKAACLRATSQSQKKSFWCVA